MNYNRPITLAISLLTVLLVASCAGKKIENVAVVELKVVRTSYHYFSSATPRLVEVAKPDSILSYLKAGDNLLFTNFYPIADTLPEISTDPFILADALERLGYEQTDGGWGNFEKGPRMRNRVYENDSLRCEIYKAYQYHELQADSTYNMLVFEQVVCNHK